MGRRKRTDGQKRHGAERRERAIGAVAASAIAAGVLAAAAVPARAVDLTIITLNDIDQIRVGGERGGLDRVKTLVDRERARGDRTVLVLFAGDALSPSLYATLDGGAHMIEALETVGIDVFVPGNHEFDFGPDVFRQRMAELDAPVLAANLRGPDGAPLEGIAGSLTIEVDGDAVGRVRVGVVGTIKDETPTVSSTGDLVFLPSVDTAAAEARALREAGADFVIAVAHEGDRGDQALVRTGAADAIASGDDHVLTLAYDGRTVLTESAAQGAHVVLTDIVFEQAAPDRAVTWRPSFRIVDTADFEPDPDIVALAEALEAGLSPGLDTPIARTLSAFDTQVTTVRAQESGFGNLVADALRETTGADVALMNGGGIRGLKDYPAGTALTRRDIATELPFANKVVVLELTGASLLAALENGFSRIGAGGGTGRFPQISGSTVVVDPSRPAGERVVEATVGGEPLDPTRTYRLATNDFLARGGDGYTMFAGAPVVLDAVDGDLLSTAVIGWLEQKGEVDPVPEGRITFR